MAMEIHGRSLERACVIGLGRSNLALIRYLRRHGLPVVGRDRAEALPASAAEELARLGVSVTLGAGYLDGLDDFDALFLTPGMRKDFPELVAAKAAGALFSSEMRLFFERCAARIVGITGSSGKTTTTTLIGKMLEAAGRPAYIGGNIGTPLIERVDKLSTDDLVVLALSSFQLELLDRSPHIAVVTNIAPNHLDIHADMAAYVAAKRQIVAAQTSGDYAVLNAEDPEVVRFAESTPARILWFGGDAGADGGYEDGGVLWLNRDGRTARICAVEEIALLGRHNVSNVLTAATAVSALDIPVAAMSEAARTFSGVADRLERVRERTGVCYVNDSKATTPASAIAGIHAFREPIVLIAGGYDKQLPFDTLAEAVCRPGPGVAGVQAVVALGDTAAKIVAALHAEVERGGRQPRIVQAESFDAAVQKAAELAAPGSVVLLSPACASYDMFDNFEQRGQRFRELVAALP